MQPRGDSLPRFADFPKTTSAWHESGSINALHGRLMRLLMSAVTVLPFGEIVATTAELAPDCSGGIMLVPPVSCKGNPVITIDIPEDGEIEQLAMELHRQHEKAMGVMGS